MATWIAHMRIAEYFMKINDKLNCIDFLIGNIAPDCGVPNEDWSKFTPDKNITHWQLDGKNTDAEDFRKKYVKKETEGYYFYLGYYFHLLTDIAWKKVFQKPEYTERIKRDKNFIWEIKKDWYGHDHIFLQNNPDFIFFTMFSKIKEYDNKYFDFYPKDAFSRQIQYITNFYLTARENLEREFPYMSKSEMDSFINNTVISLKKVYDTLK